MKCALASVCLFETNLFTEYLEGVEIVVLSIIENKICVYKWKNHPEIGWPGKNKEL